MRDPKTKTAAQAAHYATCTSAEMKRRSRLGNLRRWIRELGGAKEVAGRLNANDRDGETLKLVESWYEGRAEFGDEVFATIDKMAHAKRILDGRAAGPGPKPASKTKVSALRRAAKTTAPTPEPSKEATTRAVLVHAGVEIGAADFVEALRGLGYPIGADARVGIYEQESESGGVTRFLGTGRTVRVSWTESRTATATPALAS